MSAPNAHTYTLEDIRSKNDGQWDGDNKSSVNDAKPNDMSLQREDSDSHVGVKVTIDKQVGYDDYPHAR
jgi:hypothetical protein